MYSNVSHTIRTLLRNTPVAVSVNDSTTSVITDGGNLYQSGLIGCHVNNTFEERFSSENIVGKIVDVESVEDKVYLLNSTGSVFSYGNGKNGCESVTREIYSPAACGGDKAAHISSGKSHVLILTENNKVWGAGNNEEYQLVPQGQCKYETAVELFITDTNLHDNDSCNSFTGLYNEMRCPVIPKYENQCNNISCIKNTKCDILLGYINISSVVVSPPCEVGLFSVPVYGDITYVGFLCVDESDCVSGTLTWTITKLYIKCGCFVSKFTTIDSCGCHVREFNTSSTTEVSIYDANCVYSPNTDTCCTGNRNPLVGTSQIIGKCGECVNVNIDLSTELLLPAVTGNSNCKTILLSLNGCTTSLTALCDTELSSIGSDSLSHLELDMDVQLDCCKQDHKPPNNILPQPCWSAIYAGYNISVLKDSCNRLYVLGSLHEIRSNKGLLQGSCLTELLNHTQASVSFPADQLNCTGNRSSKNDKCYCDKCGDKVFETDLTKFGVHLNFPAGNDRCDSESMNVCEFLDKLKKCNEATNCEPTCEPCDGYIHLNISGSKDCDGKPVPNIGSFTIFNKKSICKLVSQGRPDIKCVATDLSTLIEFDLKKFCIDTTDVPLDKIIKLEFCNSGPNVNIYINTDIPGGIKFVDGDHESNVDFPINASSKSHQFLLNFGSILDPVELTNLKYALSLDCYYPCSQFKNPFDTKITNTYLRGGDHVRFVTGNPKNIRQAVTPDIPTVFRLNRRIIDVAVGLNNMTILAGGLSCPNEIFAIGNNCRGELGLGNNETITCFKKVNKCQFDCQVSNIFAGDHVTFYATQSHHIYATGYWKDFVNSNTPILVKSICQSWKIKQIAISNTHIVLLGSDGYIFGMGDNKLGELGLRHNEYVCKPRPLVFFNKLNTQLANKLNFPLDRSCNNPCSNPCINPCRDMSCSFPVRERSDDCDNDSCEPNLRERRFPKNKQYRPNNRIYPYQNNRY